MLHVLALSPAKERQRINAYRTINCTQIICILQKFFNNIFIYSDDFLRVTQYFHNLYFPVQVPRNGKLGGFQFGFRLQGVPH